MPFNQLETVTAAKLKSDMATISYRRGATTKSGRPKPTLYVVVPAARAGAFKPKAGTQFGLFLGDGKETGKARILPMVGGCAPVVMRKTVRFRFGFVPYLGDSAAEKEHIALTEIPNGFEMTLPAWFKPDEE